MRIIIYIVLSFLLNSVLAFGQDTPRPPSPPSTTTQETTYSSTTISIDGDVVDTNEGNSYFSSSDSNDLFKVRAKFHKNKTSKIREYLIEELGDENMTQHKTQLKWLVHYKGDKSYELKLDEGSLRIYVDKELTSSSMVNKFKALTKNIKTYTSGKSDEKREQESAERGRDELQREADRKIREADKLRRDAERLQREAERLEKDATRKARNM